MKIAAWLYGSVEEENKKKKKGKSLPGCRTPMGDSYISSLFVSLTEQTKRSRLVYSRDHKDAHGGIVPSAANGAAAAHSLGNMSIFPRLARFIDLSQHEY